MFGDEPGGPSRPGTTYNSRSASLPSEQTGRMTDGLSCIQIGP